MIRTNRLVIVEGKYDKIKLESIIDAIIIPTHGFSIFKDKKKCAFIKEYAKKHGVLILTDSDAAGFKIRNYIASMVPAEYILNAYIPDILGKEKRKATFSSERKLGVEGVESQIIIQALKNAGIEDEKVVESHTSSYDLYRLGLFGRPDSKKQRLRLIYHLQLPERISKNNLLKYINRNFTKEGFEAIVAEVEEEYV
ncbi:MAG: DUF4093 domain-containing protein [Ruminococcaceae bacterium]|nr:DUF4093 domain-containing protein [Oscillospiraceae bacterium]